jgi:hypothetical protein
MGPLGDAGAGDGTEIIGLSEMGPQAEKLRFFRLPEASSFSRPSHEHAVFAVLIRV